MKTVGLIGGIAPESTIVYYRSIIAAYRERRQDGSQFGERQTILFRKCLILGM